MLDAKGDLIVATAADTPARLAVGSANQVLTVDSSTATGLKWATPAAGGMTLISTTTMTGSGVTLSSIPSTYNHLQLVIRSFKPATDGGLYIRFNNDGNTRYYSSVSNDLYSSGTSYNASSFTVSNTQDSGGDNGLIIVDIFDYTNTATWKFVNSSALTQHGTTNTDLNYRFGFGAWNQTSAISQLDFYPASGNFTSGTILLYGVK